VRIPLFISGLVPIAAGIFFLVNEGQTFAALAFVAGAALLSFGLIGAFMYCLARRRLGVPGWFLADSLAALFLSVVTLQNRITDGDVAQAVFGVWLAAAGAMRVAGAAEMSGESAGFRRALLILGLLSGAMGAYGFFRPFLPEIGMTGVLGGILILQGLSAVAVGAGLSGKRANAAPDGAKVESAAARRGARDVPAGKRRRRPGGNIGEKTPPND
jgi:uncharacterized membrane protein HdeD (DUF308 family)